jgi:hypothetical protein
MLKATLVKERASLLKMINSFVILEIISATFFILKVAVASE